MTPDQITMNPLPPSDELYIQISSANYSLPIPTAPEDQILHDPVMDYGSGTVPCTDQKGKGKQRKQLPTWGTEDHQMDENNKKWMRREAEKQRRQEMARLCTTFRTLLPSEYIKVKTIVTQLLHINSSLVFQLYSRFIYTKLLKFETH